MNAAATMERTDPATGEIETVESDFERLMNQQASPRALLMDDASFDKIYRIAEAMADGSVAVPKHLQGKVGDCLAIVTQAMQWDMNPFAVAQKTHVVNGALGYEAQLVNAVVQKSGAIRGHFSYEFRGTGADLECRVGAVLRGDTEKTWGEWYSAKDVKVKNSPLWQSNPKQQLSYLQVKNWSRAFAPGAILGVYTPDELEDTAPEPTKPAGPRRRSEAAAPAPAASAPPAAEPAAAPPPAAAPTPAAKAPAPAGGNAIAAGQVAYLRNKLKAAGVAEQSICDRFQVSGIELLSIEQFDEVKAELLKME